jgi:hypothetical protein
MPANPSRTRIPRLVKLWREKGCQAVLGTKNIPYTTEQIEIRLKEMAVASGAPIKPKAMGSGPHTECKREWPVSSDGEGHVYTE